jgi:hypothetical protein
MGQDEDAGREDRAGTRALHVARWALLALFVTQFVALDLALRRGRALHQITSSPGAALAALHSVLLWGAIAIAAGKRPLVRVAAALLAGFAAAFQGLFHERLGRFADHHVVRSALASWGDVAPAFHAEVPRLVALAILVAALQELWLRACARPALSRRHVRHAGVGALALLLLSPLSATFRGPPDLRLFGAVRGLPLGSPAPAAVAATRLAGLQSTRASLPNVVVILTESVRADEYCSAPADECKAAPEVNALLPDRVGLPQMRSSASFTVVSLAALFTGRTQNMPREDLLRAPTLFDAVSALGAGEKKPFTAYWSAHEAPMFHWGDPKRSIDSYVTFETLFDQAGESTIADVRLAEMFAEELSGLRSPYFLVLHFHDTHILYGFDEARAPFSPWTREVRWETMPGLRNAYRNAIHAQDRSVAAAMRALRADPRWASTFVLFTSDHGESFGEDSAIHHGQSMLDEQVHVPAWVAHGKDALSAPQAAALRENAGALVTHLDIAPTLLDLYGVWGSPELLPHTARMPGRSLLRPLAPAKAVAMTNCSETFPCAFNTWGLMRGEHKIEAQAWDSEWQCHRIGGDEEEPLPLRDPACQSLVAESRGQFAELPSGTPND